MISKQVILYKIVDKAVSILNNTSVTKDAVCSILEENMTVKKDQDVSPKETESDALAVTPDIQNKIDWIKANEIFRGKKVTYDEGTFFVNGDIMLSEQDVDARMSKGKPGSGKNAQRKTEFKVSTDRVKDIKLYFGTRGILNTSWDTAFHDAVDQWNAQVVNSLVRFRVVTNEEVSNGGPGSFDVAVQYYSRGNEFLDEPNAVAAAEFPYADGSPGRTIQIAKKFDNEELNLKIAVATHELGHIIGLAHTDLETAGDLIPGTPETDATSIMNHVYGPEVLSSNDVKAVEILYPKELRAPIWQKLPGLGTDIAVGADGSVFIISATQETASGGNAIYKWNGSSWIKINGAGLRIAVDPSGNPWMINAQNKIYRYQ